jgi:hypothetical protein
MRVCGYPPAAHRASDSGGLSRLPESPRPGPPGTLAPARPRGFISSPGVRPIPLAACFLGSIKGPRIGARLPGRAGPWACRSDRQPGSGPGRPRLPAGPAAAEGTSRSSRGGRGVWQRCAGSGAALFPGLQICFKSGTARRFRPHGEETAMPVSSAEVAPQLVGALSHATQVRREVSSQEPSALGRVRPPASAPSAAACVYGAESKTAGTGIHPTPASIDSF